MSLRKISVGRIGSDGFWILCGDCNRRKSDSIT